MEAIKAKYQLSRLEIHTAWLARMYPEQERIQGFSGMDHDSRRVAVRHERRADLAKAALRGRKAVAMLAKNYKKSDIYIHLTHQERKSLLAELALCIGQNPEIILFCDAQEKSCHLQTKPDEDILKMAHEQIVSRFNHCLRRRDDGFGIVVADHSPSSSRWLTDLTRDYYDKGGTQWSSLTNIVETPLFVDSSLTSLVQAADLISYSTRRFFENNETELFNVIYPRFDRTTLGKQPVEKVVGLRHYTGTRQCSCRVCLDHGRN